jgi:hypothetical protein
MGVQDIIAIRQEIKDKPIVQRALDLKAKGFTHAASILKQHYSTNYYNVVSLDSVISAGKWIGAGKRARGISHRRIDWKTTWSGKV